MMRFWLVEGCVVACSPADDLVVIVSTSYNGVVGDGPSEELCG
jgi:hypothetical protein